MLTMMSDSRDGGGGEIATVGAAVFFCVLAFVDVRVGLRMRDVFFLVSVFEGFLAGFFAGFIA